MFSLPQQIYTVVSDGPGFLLKRSPPIINSMAADTARHLHSSLTLQDCSQGLGGGMGEPLWAEVGWRMGAGGGHEGQQTGWWCRCVLDVYGGYLKLKQSVTWFDLWGTCNLTYQAKCLSIQLYWCDIRYSYFEKSYVNVVLYRNLFKRKDAALKLLSFAS